MQAVLRAIEYHLPSRVLSNAELAELYPGWPAEKITEKTGIAERRIAADGECASDLAFGAAQKLFESGVCRRQDIDFILLCTQAPDYFLPTTACLLQDRLGVPTTAGALDFNLGSSGFVYGLGLAKGLIETGQARTILFLTAETYTKFIHPLDKSTRTVFGDGAAATLIQGVDGTQECAIGPFVFGTDGRHGDKLIVPEGGMRKRDGTGGEMVRDSDGNTRGTGNLFMDGAELFTFAMVQVPRLIKSLLAQAQTSMEEIDFFVLHQGNRFMLESLRRKLQIPEEKYWNSIQHCGNTVSNTIPIALRQAWESGRIHQGEWIALAGFGVGYSWAGAMIRWQMADA
jgi:3-oxoacyl-[acyl-carrier-protein] synthase-3